MPQHLSCGDPALSKVSGRTSAGAERIAVVGGGPGGLFFAALAKQADPSREITVFERNRAEDTFGFGVVFSDATLAGIHAADPVLRDALTEFGVHWDPIEVRLKGSRVSCGGNGMAAVERRTLLRLLQDRARASGAELQFETEVEPAELLGVGYDLVVAGDGANSRLRQLLDPEFGSSFETATAKFIWFGTTYPFDGLTFIHERGPHGVFAVHGYPIGNGQGTFIVETDETSWWAAGLDEFDVSAPPGPSDEKSRGYLEELFAESIDGHPLLVNNSRWGNFRTRRAQRWATVAESGSAVALLGDSAHTAHFSVGSGTKMAMEDSIALSAALDAHPGDLPAALGDYQSTRQPDVAKIQNAARPSLSWWEHFGRYHDALEPWQFAYHFFSRSLPDAKLRRRDTAFVDRTHGEWIDQHGSTPLETPIPVGNRLFPTRSVVVTDGRISAGSESLTMHTEPPAAPGAEDWGITVDAPDTEAGLAAAIGRVDRAVDAGAVLVCVRDGTRLTRRLVCEHARMVRGIVAALVDDAGADPEADLDAAVTAVLSGRTDLVAAAH